MYKLHIALLDILLYDTVVFRYTYYYERVKIHETNSISKSKAERDLENLEKAAEEFRKVAEDAAKQYDEVKNDFDDYNQALERIQGK